MPSWLPLLSVYVFCCTLVVPLFVLGASGGNWRLALTAWRQYCLWLGLLAAPGMLAGLWMLIFPPVL